MVRKKMFRAPLGFILLIANKGYKLDVALAFVFVVL